MSKAKSVTDELLDAATFVKLAFLPHVRPSTTGPFVKCFSDYTPVPLEVLVDCTTQSSHGGLLPLCDLFPYERAPGVTVEYVSRVIVIAVTKPNRG